nr:MAG TPA: hypothetical protein [Caudoviricetes sp.]
MEGAIRGLKYDIYFHRNKLYNVIVWRAYNDC